MDFTSLVQQHIFILQNLLQSTINRRHTMLMRKINAGLSLLTTFLLLNHAIFNAVRMLSQGAVGEFGTFIPWVLFGIMLAHAFVSIDLAISAHEGAEKRKCKSYPKLNAVTIFQRFSGIALILFTALHVAGAAGFMTPPPIVHAIVPTVFFTVALAHTAVSTSKAFITLGIGNAKFIKVLDIVVKVICVATLVASLIGFYLYKV